MLYGCDEGILGDVFRVIPAARHQIGAPEEHQMVFLVQLLEQIPVRLHSFNIIHHRFLPFFFIDASAYKSRGRDGWFISVSIL